MASLLGTRSQEKEPPPLNQDDDRTGENVNDSAELPDFL